MKRIILLIDDNLQFLRSIRPYIPKEYEFKTAVTSAEGIALAEAIDPDIVLLDMCLPTERDGLATLRKLIQLDRTLPVIIVTQFPNDANKRSALQSGAVFYTSKTPNMETLLAVIEQRAQMLPDRQMRKKMEKENLHKLVCDSPAMQRVIQEIEKCASSDVPVLLLGETGSGKGIIANEIHRLSFRASKPLISVNCPAVTPTLFESEFFGHEAGAFTGATGRKRGKFLVANNSTLFLDEIGELPLAMQPKLLETLESKTFYPVGSEKSVSSNARIIAATNRDLEKAVEEKLFRSDLFYRLNVFAIHVPPLRARREDIPEMVRLFLFQLSREYKLETPFIEDEVFTYWQNKTWKGNVRELRNEICKAAFNAQGGSVTLETLNVTKGRLGFFSFYESVLRKRSFAEAKDALLKKFEFDFISRALKTHNHNLSKIARTIGVDRSTVYRVLKRMEE